MALQFLLCVYYFNTKLAVELRGGDCCELSPLVNSNFCPLMAGPCILTCIYAVHIVVSSQ